MKICGMAVCLERKKSGVPQDLLLCDEYGIQKDLHYKRGEKQVSILPLEEVQKYIAESGEICNHGRFGENLLLSGLDLTSLQEGDFFYFDQGVVLQVVKIGAGGPASDAYKGFKVCVPMEPFFVFCKVLTGGALTTGEKYLLKGDI